MADISVNSDFAPRASVIDADTTKPRGKGANESLLERTDPFSPQNVRERSRSHDETMVEV